MRILVKTVLALALLGLMFAGGGSAKAGPLVEKNVVAYHEPGRFVQGVANRGIWSWGNEIMVGASGGYFQYKYLMAASVDRSKPRRELLCRSLDGGETWSVEAPVENGSLDFSSEAVDCPGDIDFTNPDFALNLLLDEAGRSAPRFYYSYDRGRTWKGPFKLPDFVTGGIVGARTSYLVNGKDDCMLFLTADKANGREGRSFCARTVDGGETWAFVSWIGPEPTGFAIMPVAVRLSETEIVAAVRRNEGRKHWISLYDSKDNGQSWEYMNDPVSDLGEGNPPALVRLSDGRLCLTYGVRARPYRICAKLSGDGGQTWGEEIVLRQDADNWELGYVRSAVRPDGKVVTVYYHNDTKTGPEPYIGATIWDPGQ
jgi:hypothetical protein